MDHTVQCTGYIGDGSHCSVCRIHRGWITPFSVQGMDHTVQCAGYIGMDHTIQCTGYIGDGSHHSVYRIHREWITQGGGGGRGMWTCFYAELLLSH